ncbi:MAG: NAD(P)/FAD-dependent oxidoreductase [Solirubrobacterales bacterium]|nr:NAD(P)/FAD-dependent oxidoreductase [Solirubrobacterales bacterium]
MRPLRIAVLGAGVAGLTAALRLGQAGHGVDVYERWPGLGGQAATVDVGSGHLLERYYHHWFTSDRHIVRLCEELGVAEAIQWRPSSVAFFVDGAVHPFTGPLDLLRFGPLPLRDRLRMGLAVVRLQRAGRAVEAYEGETARAWIERTMGPRAWATVWGPLLRGKFGSRADDISMAWLWGKLTLRRKLEGREARQELLGYPGRSFEPLFGALRAAIEARGGRVLIDRPAAALQRAADGGLAVTPAAPGAFRLGHDPRAFAPDGEAQRYDAVIATVPSDVFAALLDDGLRCEVGAAYLARLDSIEYHAALCLLLELDRRFTSHYWTNVADPALPFVGLIEHTNLVEPGHYGGRRFLYVANYLEHGHELLSLDADALLERYLPGLRAVNPAFDPSWVRASWLHREPAAQPIVDVGYRERIPPLRTGARGLVLANTTQVYPEDRGTNYAVRLGEQAAQAVGG